MITTNTDGDPISQAFAAAMAEPSVMYSMKLLRNGSDLGAVIKRAKLDLGAGQFSDDLGTFAACGVYQTQFSASLYDCPSILGDELEVRVGVLTGNAYEYVAVAYVTITEESVWKGVTDVRGVGRMGLMHAPHGLAEGDYQPAAVASAIYAATGIVVSIDARLTTQSVHADAGGTCRDALESMCARLGAYACELGEGVSVMPYSSTVTGTIPTGHVTGKPELGALYEVDGITVEAGEESFVQGTGRVHIVDGTATATTAAATWGNMRGYAFTPATLNIALIDPRWTVADMLEVTLVEDDYSIPARGISITYDGGYFGTVSAAGLTAEAEEMTVEGPLTRSVGYARSVADEALEVAQATGQYFWHDTNGAHVSTEALNPTGASNSLWNSLGLLIRKAANNLVSITQSAIAFFDGNGNDASNITASFGSSGFQIGQDDGSHVIGDYHSLQLVDKEGNVYFHVSDLRDSSGYATITETQVASGGSNSVQLDYSARSLETTSVVVSGEPDITVASVSGHTVLLSRTPSAGAVITVTYQTDDQFAKAYTFGVRSSSGTVGAVSIAEGWQTTASGQASHAEGSATTAGGVYSHAEGMSSIANGAYSHAEGNQTTTDVMASSSHAEGSQTIASNTSSHAEGHMSTASGYVSHAEGYICMASGWHSHAQNNGTVADSIDQTALGRFNEIDSNNVYAEIVGNGSLTRRSNARTLDWNGNEVLAGGLTLGSPLTVANGGTGATSATDARNALSVPSVASQTNQLVNFSAGSGSTQVQAIYFNVTNSSSAYEGKRLALLIRQDGISLYNGTDNSTLWTTAVSTNSPTLTNATATAFELRKTGSVVNLQIQQLKVSASLADGSAVSLGTGIIPSGSRPAHAIGIPLVSNAAGKGAGCWLYITADGNVTLYNRSGSALGTNTNLYGNATWVV